MIRGCLVAFVALVALAPLPAVAFEVHRTSGGDPLHWASFPVSYGVSLDSVADADRTWILRVLRRGPEAWTTLANAAVPWRYTGPSDGTFTDDGVSELVFFTTRWPSALGDPTINAAATVHRFDDATGELRDVDVGFNGAGFRWADEERDASALDLWAISAHETGHALGLDHSDVLDALMFPAATPGDTSRRAPVADDDDGLESIYGVTVFSVAPVGEVSKSCPSGNVPEEFVFDGFSVTEVEFVNAFSGEVIPGSLGNPLDVSALTDGEWDVVAIAADGKSRAFYGAVILPPPLCPPPVCAYQCGCACSASDGSASLLLLLPLLTLSRRRR